MRTSMRTCPFARPSAATSWRLPWQTEGDVQAPPKSGNDATGPRRLHAAGSRPTDTRKIETSAAAAAAEALDRRQISFRHHALNVQWPTVDGRSDGQRLKLT